MATQYQSKMTYSTPAKLYTPYVAPKPAVYPVPTPNPQVAGAGAGYPTTYKTSVLGASTTTPSWDANRYISPTQGLSNYNLNTQINKANIAPKPTANVLGASTSNNPSGGATASWNPEGSSGGNGGSGTTPSTPTLSYLNNNPNLGLTDNNPYASLEAAAQQGDAAARAQLETLYAQRDAELQNQLNYATEQKGNTLSELDRQLQNYFSGVDKQKVQTNEDVASSIGEAASTAQNVQRQNRNVLRGLGILNSTYAADQLAQPMNQFDTQRAQLQKWGLSQIANLDDQKRQKQAEADSQRNQIVSQFNDLMGKIQTDMRFNQREKIGAMQAAQAALQQRMAEINSSKVAYQQQIDQTRNALLSDLVKLQAAQSPKADIGSIMAKSLAAIQSMYTPQPSQQVSIYGATDQNKRKTLSGTY